MPRRHQSPDGVARSSPALGATHRQRALMKRRKVARQRVVLRSSTSSAPAAPLYQMRQWLLRESLTGLLRRAAEGSGGGLSDEQTTEQVVRLGVAASMLLERHQVDGRGRCRGCRTRLRWRLRRNEPCTVQAVLDLCLNESLDLVWRQVGNVTARTGHRTLANARRFPDHTAHS